MRGEIVAKSRPTVPTFLAFTSTFILRSLESDQRRCNELAYELTPTSLPYRYGESCLEPFPPTKVNLQACSSHCPSNAERQAEKV